MCGIVGIAADRALTDAERSSSRRMADSIIHRGPDDEGFFDTEEAVLGMRRLSIIDLSGGQQPIANEDETVWVVCNGEIYNFRELRQDLEARGHRFRTHSDVEVIVHLYEEYGKAFVDHISGMFGIALWDARQKRLFLVRDRVGIKPLYFSHENGRLCWGSEIKCLLEVPGINAELDPAGLRDHLAVGYAIAPRTIFKSVFKLPPATMLEWSNGSIETHRYWDVPAEVDNRPDEAEWIERVQDGFERAVASHMVSDVPIGAFLSGGIDSSAIVALMGKQTGEPVSTYSIGYAGDAVADYYNELPWAGQVARAFNTRHHEIHVQPDVTTLLPKLLWHLEEPISDSAITTTFLVSQLAAESVKVILSGVGGDELFAGYNRYLGDHYTSLYRRVPAWLRRGVVQPIAGRLPSGRQNRWMDLSRYARSFVKSAELPWSEQYKLYIALESEAMLGDLIGDDSLATPDGFDRILASETADDPLLRLLRVDWQTQLGEDLLQLTDKMTMAESIECRVPFLDHEFLELAARIPTARKRPGNQLKYLLKKSLEPELSRDILYRTKRGFGAPIGAWFKGQLLPLRSSLLSRGTVAARGWLNPDAVDRVCQLHDSNQEDYTDLLLVLINLEIWARLFLDGQSSEDVGGSLADSLASTATA